MSSFYTNVHQKSQSYDVCFLKYGEQDIIFCHFGPFFTLLPPLTNQKIKTLKNEKKKQTNKQNTRRYHHFQGSNELILNYL